MYLDFFGGWGDRNYILIHYVILTQIFYRLTMNNFYLQYLPVPFYYIF